ncbi:FAD-binding protein, partial [Salmonella enterica subsp. enterica serovar Virginia]|nr:FAD-binding protein [Salmonella enterica subsp. enterica serovar Virginia]
SNGSFAFFTRGDHIGKVNSCGHHHQTDHIDRAEEADAGFFHLTEALRGEGAYLKRPDGSRFMPDVDERGELAPRDIVARAIDH